MPYRVGEGFREHLLELPESGMGFQVVRDDESRRLVLNTEVALILDDPDVISAEFMWLQEQMEVASSEEADAWLGLIDDLEPVEMARCEVEVHGSYGSLTVAGEAFVRYSAFANDRRIGNDGSVLAGTYCTTGTDAAIVPSGLAAVGRYALPNPNPAVYRFDLHPTIGSPILCGPVAPKFGQAGGGVEIRFGQPGSPGTAVGRTRIAER